MAKIAYFDCFSGISGDMTLGALIDAGLAVEQLIAELQKLNVAGWEIVAERGVRYGIAGTRLQVRTEEQHTHRHLSDITQILQASALDHDIQQQAIAIFSRLAVAEAAVHGTTADDVHFHEVGALDAIVDIVGVVIGLKLLNITNVFASALPLGTGWINAAHGRIPVPGPAVLQLLGVVNAPLKPDTTPFELVTPTGAAILAELAIFKQPEMTLTSTGYGFGGRDIGRLNAVRVWIGEQLAVNQQEQSQNNVVLLQTNIDDQPAEQLAFVAERLLALGALDVWWTSIGMKKGRAALMLSVLAHPTDEAQLVTTIFRETTSLGIRRQLIERWVCERRSRTIATRWGDVRVKEQRWAGELLGMAPEYEDCAAIARTRNLPIRVVYAAVQEAIDGLRPTGA